MSYQYFDRDISWLSFNERVLGEATRLSVPLAERLKFLSIYSSNLDEFYRVRIPALMALHKITREKEKKEVLEEIRTIIDRQLAFFGDTLTGRIIPDFGAGHLDLVYDRPVPAVLKESLRIYFLTRVAAFVRRVYLENTGNFFPLNNQVYLFVSLRRNQKKERAIINIPSNEVPRFYTLAHEGRQHVIFLDDIVRDNLGELFPGAEILGCWSFKITRDAELNLLDEYEGDIADLIERQIAKRDMGLATRVLLDRSMEEQEVLLGALQLKYANVVKGGRYHNLRDLADFPVTNPAWFYEPWPPVKFDVGASIFGRMEQGDFALHPPYHDYDTVLRFFNEAALDEKVTEMYITLYRVASDSRIVHALITAAENGKKVLVFVELLARFDEENNIRWAKKMKAAGVRIVYSVPGMKVHAKMALIKRKAEKRDIYYGLLSTGNLNETTARFYTDHILFTCHKAILREMELLFLFLKKREQPGKKASRITFEHLMVARFNLLERLTGLIRFETKQAKKKLPALITLKLNNLEEETLINELYLASSAGVRIRLIIRGICRLVPGVPGMSEHITVHRIVDRYLEHGRVYIFHHGGKEQIFAGSADWMDRNMYRRIEACFPLYDPKVRAQIKEMIALQLEDNVQAVQVDEWLHNVPVPVTGKAVASQYEQYQRIKKNE